MRLWVFAVLLGGAGCTPCPSHDLVCNYRQCLPSSNVHDDDRQRCVDLARQRADQK